MELGQHWGFRARPKELGSMVRRVEIVRVGGRGRSGWLHVRFLEGDDAGLQEWVNPSCLVARWGDVEAFRADDSSELALAVASREVRGSADFEAARMVLGFVRPRSKLRLRRGVSDAGILELIRLEEGARLVGMDAAELRSDPMVYENRDGLCLAGWPVTERIARLVAGRLAEDILPEVDRRQQAIDQERTQSSWYSYSRRDDRKLDAEAAVLRTVRDWCGQDKAERYDELVALREEVVRLGKLVEKSVKALRDRGHGVIASTIERDLGVHISSLGPDVRR
ncbi:PE-PGRS family protein [Streptomyces sp. SP18CS02]|uniref:PE-PGRS family protein n=1 Tax=Streptomyces sp. SP18CS02 TaxID=3002531 RepID=UPI002E76506D|nr:PE-PGRS family protein [Streptomyces sp. SP18CS02]MEE1754213.1 PE-PGRS family protein [Streptomyces sp. SP18CS02]